MYVISGTIFKFNEYPSLLALLVTIIYSPDPHIPIDIPYLHYTITCIYTHTHTHTYTYIHKHSYINTEWKKQNKTEKKHSKPEQAIKQPEQRT